MYEERSQQYQDGLLRFCDCHLGQAAQRYFANLNANAYGLRLADEAAQRRAEYLEKLDGLLPDEREWTLKNYTRTRFTRQAVEAVEAMIRDGHGLVTLQGSYGVGKTQLMKTAVNECRRRDRVSIYNSVRGLFDWLKEGFDQEEFSKKQAQFKEDAPLNLAFTKRWKLATSCACLCLDELTGVNMTAWASERLEGLIDERWRRIDKAITVIGFNGTVDQLPGWIQSRLYDRRGKVITVGGFDMRNPERSMAAAARRNGDADR